MGRNSKRIYYNQTVFYSVSCGIDIEIYLATCFPTSSIKENVTKKLIQSGDYFNNKWCDFQPKKEDIYIINSNIHEYHAVFIEDIRLMYYFRGGRIMILSSSERRCNIISLRETKKNMAKYFTCHKLSAVLAKCHWPFTYDSFL